MSEKIIPIPARLKNVSRGGHVAGSEDIIDDSLQKTLAELNLETNAAIEALYGDTLIIVSELPASGIAGKIYRVPGTGSYTDYMWDASLTPAAFVELATYTGGSEGDFFNVNAYNNVLTTPYLNAAEARGYVPSGVRKQGLLITYLLAGGWFTDQYIGTATDSTSWATASNWKAIGPVSVSQNNQTKEIDISVGGTITSAASMDNVKATTAELENRVVSLRDPYIWGVGEAYKLHAWVDSDLCVQYLAASEAEQIALYGENNRKNLYVIRVHPGDTINLQGVSNVSWMIFLKEFSYDYLINTKSLNYIKSIVSSISPSRITYSESAMVNVPNDTNFVIISNDEYTAGGSVVHHLFSSFVINGIDIINPPSMLTETDLYTNLDGWENGGYIDSNGQVVETEWWQHLITEISSYNSLYINSTLNGNLTYGFLLDEDGAILKQWYNEVVQENVDLLNDYPTAVTLKLSGRGSATNYVRVSKFIERVSDVSESKQMVYPLLGLNGKYMHFSVDDSRTIWLELVQNPSVASIFDTQYFAALKDIHDATGMCVTINLMCCNVEVGQTPPYTLSDIPNTWAAEFQANADWLKFSLHSYYTDQAYGTPVAGHSLLEDFTYCNTQIERFTGTKDCISRHLRLGYFNCPSEQEAISIIGQNNTGVKMYSTADDTRASNMYLDETERNEINSKGLLYDTINELVFIKSMPRLDDSINISSLISNSLQYKSSQKLLEMFCHEGSYITLKSSMITLFNTLKNDYKYQWGFLPELFNN